jgi:transcriptional regulator with XRE-family HTH domain
MPTPSFEALRILGTRLRDARVKLGLNQYDVAHDSMTDAANYGRLERGIGNPTLLTLLRLCVRLGVDPGELVAGLDDRELLPPEARPFTASEFRREQERRRKG